MKENLCVVGSKSPRVRSNKALVGERDKFVGGQIVEAGGQKKRNYVDIGVQYTRMTVIQNKAQKVTGKRGIVGKL